MFTFIYLVLLRENVLTGYFGTNNTTAVRRYVAHDNPRASKPSTGEGSTAYRKSAAYHWSRAHSSNSPVNWLAIRNIPFSINADKTWWPQFVSRWNLEVLQMDYVMTSCSAPPLNARFRWTRDNAECESGSQIQVRLTYQLLFKTHKYFNTFHLPKYVDKRRTGKEIGTFLDYANAANN